MLLGTAFSASRVQDCECNSNRVVELQLAHKQLLSTSVLTVELSNCKRRHQLSAHVSVQPHAVPGSTLQ